MSFFRAVAMVLNEHVGETARLGIGHALGSAFNMFMLCAGCIYMHGTQPQAEIQGNTSLQT